MVAYDAAQLVIETLIVDWPPYGCELVADHRARLKNSNRLNQYRHMSARFLSLVGGVLIAIVAFFATQHAGLTTAQSWTAAVATLCAIWWVLEALPLSATALVPVVIFPLAGVLTTDKAAAAYGDPLILLFLGGFMLSRAAEYWGAHRRIAQVALNLIGGTSGRRVVLAVLVATTFISAWINNTATALMMLPVALALMDRDKTGKLAVPLLLSVAYGSSIGGIATPIGTAPNGIFMGVYQKATGLTVPFHQWMMLCVPITIVMMIAAWLLLTYKLSGVDDLEIPPDEQWTAPQKRTLAVFGLACLGWITREIPFGGWTTWFGVPGHRGYDRRDRRHSFAIHHSQRQRREGQPIAQLEDCGRYSVGRLDSIRRRHLPRDSV